MPKRLALYLGVLLALYLVFLLRLLEKPLYSDFAKFHASAQLHLEGKSIYTPLEVDRFMTWTPELGPKPLYVHPNLNPPFLTLLMLPLAPLRFPDAWWVFSILSLFCGMGAMARLEAATRTGPASVSRQLGFQLVLLAYFPTIANFQYGQLTLFLFWPVVESWIAARRRADFRAGAWLGLVLAVKPFFLLFVLFFLIRRRWLLIAAMGVSGALCTALSLAVFGWDTLLQYRSVVGDITWAGTNWNGSFLGIFTRLLGGSDSQPLVHMPQLARALASACSVAAAAVLAILTQRHQSRGRDFDLGFALTLALMLLISPLGWVYYYPLLILSYLMAWQVLEELPSGAARPWRWILFASLVLSTLPIPLMSALEEMPSWHWWLWSGTHSYALLLLAAGLVGLWSRASRFGGNPPAAAGSHS